MNNVSEEWKKISTDTIELMLPESFIGGHPKKDKSAIQEQISHKPEELREIYKNMFKAIKSEFSAVEIHKEQEKNHSAQEQILAIWLIFSPLKQKNMHLQHKLC